MSYEPAESQSGIFGGNSNWRGPVWFPINYLLIESLQQFHHYYGDDFRVECPTGSGQFMHLKEVANELSNRLIKLFLRDENGEYPFARGSGNVVAATDGRGPEQSQSTAVSDRGSTTRIFSTNTSMATPVQVSARPIKPVGPRWSQSSFNNRANSEPLNNRRSRAVPTLLSGELLCLPDRRHANW